MHALALKSSLAWMGLAQALSFVLQFGGSVVLAHFLTPYQMGIYAVAAATVGVISIIQALGLQSLIVREETLTREIQTTAFTINALIAIGLSVVIAGMSVLGGAFLHDDGVRRVLLVLALSPLFGIFDFLPSSNLERRGKFKLMSLIGVACGVTSNLTTVVLAVLGFNFMSIAYGGCASAATYALLMNICGREYVSLRVGFKAWRRTASYGLQMLAVSGVNSVSARLSDIALGRLLGLSALGIYGRASNLNGLIWNNIHLVIGRVVLVDYAELNRQKVSLRPRYIRTVEIISALLWPAFAGFAILSGPFILTIYGAKWLPAARPLAFLASASIIQVSITMTWELFAATGQLKAQTRIEFIRAIISIMVFAAACTISLSAAAAARVFDAIFAVILYRPHLNRMTNTSTADFLPIYARSALLTVLAVAPATLLMASFKMSAHVPLSFVLASAGMGIALWGAGLGALKHPLAEEALKSLKGLRRKLNRSVDGDAATLTAAASLAHEVSATRAGDYL